MLAVLVFCSSANLQCLLVYYVVVYRYFELSKILLQLISDGKNYNPKTNVLVETPTFLIINL